MTSDPYAPAGTARGVSFPATSIWFQGHFPGDPLLPGIAQLHVVLETLWGATQADIRLTGLKRVRFKRIIRPEEPIDVAVEAVPEKPGLYRFLLTVAGQTACSGLMTTTETAQ